MTDNAQTMTLEESLNKTDFGHVLYEKRKIWLTAILVIVSLILGYVYFNHQKKVKSLEASAAVYAFQKADFESYKTKKITAEEFVTKFNALPLLTKSSPSILPIILDAVGLFNAEAKQNLSYELLKESQKNFANLGQIQFLVNLHFAAIAENQGKMDEAISTLESLSKSGKKLFQAKIALDLGRLYKLQGDSAKAKLQFDYILNDFPNDELAKMAKLYLQDLNAK
jgi:predicted negative regulator of RcsB-dependent stress response